MTDGHVLSPALTVQDRGDRRSPNKWGSLHVAGPKWPIFREPGVVTWLGNIRNNRKVNLSWLSIRMSSSAFDWRHYFNEQIALAPSAEICGKVNSLPMQKTIYFK